MRIISSSFGFIVVLWASTAVAEDIRWVSSLHAATQIAAHARKPIVVHFYADWCTPCEQLDRVVFKDKRLIKALNEDVVAVKIDVGQHREIADRFGVKAVPTDVYLTSAGDMIDSTTSPQTAVEYRSTIEQLKRRRSEPTGRASARTAKALKTNALSIRQPSAGSR